MCHRNNVIIISERFRIWLYFQYMYSQCVLCSSVLLSQHINQSALALCCHPSQVLCPQCLQNNQGLFVAEKDNFTETSIRCRGCNRYINKNLILQSIHHALARKEGTQVKPHHSERLDNPLKFGGKFEKKPHEGTPKYEIQSKSLKSEKLMGFKKLTRQQLVRSSDKHFGDIVDFKAIKDQTKISRGYLSQQKVAMVVQNHDPLLEMQQPLSLDIRYNNSIESSELPTGQPICPQNNPPGTHHQTCSIASHAKLCCPRQRQNVLSHTNSFCCFTERTDNSSQMNYSSGQELPLLVYNVYVNGNFVGSINEEDNQHEGGYKYELSESQQPGPEGDLEKNKGNKEPEDGAKEMQLESY